MTQAEGHRTEERAAPKEAWDAIAPGYDEFVTPQGTGLATDALRLAGLAAGDRFLDVAAGTGGLSLPAARLGARVIATDWSPSMIERLDARIHREQIRDVEARVMDCHDLEYPDDAFDVVGSQFGVMLVPGQPQALREMVRVTRPGGRVVVIAFGHPGKFEALQFFLGAIRAVVPEFKGLPADPPPLEFQMSDPETMRQRMTDAGLRDVVIDTTHEKALSLHSGGELWNWCLGSNPIPGNLVADLTADQKAAVRDELNTRIMARTDDAGVATLTAAVNIGVGTKRPH